MQSLIFFISDVIRSFTFSDAHKVHCSEDWMKVDIVLPSETGSLVYLEGMKGYPNPKCQPESTEALAQFNLSLKDFYDCGVTRVVNKITVRSFVFSFEVLFLKFIFHTGKEGFLPQDHH